MDRKICSRHLNILSTAVWTNNITFTWQYFQYQPFAMWENGWTLLRWDYKAAAAPIMTVTAQSDREGHYWPSTTHSSNIKPSIFFKFKYYQVFEHDKHYLLQYWTEYSNWKMINIVSKANFTTQTESYSGIIYGSMPVASRKWMICKIQWCVHLWAGWWRHHYSREADAEQALCPMYCEPIITQHPALKTQELYCVINICAQPSGAMFDIS